MGKKGSWFSAIKRAFTPHSKEKLVNDSEKKTSKEKKKKSVGKLRHGDTNSFIPLFREPSSIEKIFGDYEREQQRVTLRTPLSPEEQPKTSSFGPPPRVATPRAASPRVVSPRVASPRAPSPRAPSPRAVSPRPPSPRIVHHHRENSYRPETTLRHHHASATKIQAAYRGYTARRSFRALKGLVRLQGVVRGQSVKRQTLNAMKYMQLLVRVQSQIQSRRIQMLENQARRQAQYKNDKEADSIFGKWNSETGNDDWDDSVLTKEEIEARMQRKVEALVKRERAMAYAYSHQLWKASPKSAQTPLADIRAGGFPWWYNWLERQLPTPSNPPQTTNVMKTFQLTPPRPNSEVRPPSSSAQKQQQRNFAFETMDTPTPRSTRSTIYPASKPMRTPPSGRTPLAAHTSKYSRPRASVGAGSPFDLPLKDDDSLTSCPPFSVPNYMNSTASAKAKARASSNPKERFMATPSSESKRRLSFPLTQGIGSFKWNKGSFFSNKDNGSSRALEQHQNQHQSVHSVGNMSVDSSVSLPAAVGRKPFNRFV